MADGDLPVGEALGRMPATAPATARRSRASSRTRARSGSDLASPETMASSGSPPTVLPLTEQELEDTLGRMLESRKSDIFHEFLSGENEYVVDLEVLVKDVLEPLESEEGVKDALTKEQRDAMFANAKQLWKWHKQALAEVQERSVMFPAMNNVYMFYSSLLEAFDMYVTYCNNHRNAVRMLAQARDSNNGDNAFQRFLVVLPDERDIGELLLLPVLHVLRYPQLLHEFIKHMSPELPDYEQLRTLHHKLERAVGLDRWVRTGFHSTSENQGTMRALYEEIEFPREAKTMEANFLEPGRRFINKGSVTVTQERGRASTRVLMLFSDIAVFCRAKSTVIGGKAYVYRDHVQLASMLIADAPDSGKTRHSVFVTRVDSVKSKFRMSFSSAGEKREWLKLLREGTEKALELESRKYKGVVGLDFDYLRDIQMEIEARLVATSRLSTSSMASMRSAGSAGSQRRASRVSGSSRGSRKQVTGRSSLSSNRSLSRMRPNVGQSGLSLTAPVRIRTQLVAQLVPEPDAHYLRQQAMDEILLTEATYVKDLETLVEIFVKPARKQKPASAEALNDVFSNIEELLSFNQQLQRKLDERVVESAAPSLTLGDIFVAAADGFQVYTKYCTNHDKAVKTLAKLDKESKWTKFVKTRMAYPEVNNLTLSDFLIKPIQRLTKYKLLLQELLSHTDPSHPDYQQLNLAVEKMDDVAALVDERKGAMLNQETVRRIAAQLDNCDIDVTKRRFVREGACQVAYGSNGKLSEMRVFLFDDLLIYAKARALKTNRYNVKVALDLKYLDVKETKRLENTVVLTVKTRDPPELHILQFASQYEKKLWLRDLQSRTSKLANATVASTGVARAGLRLARAASGSGDDTTSGAATGTSAGTGTAFNPNKLFSNNKLS